MLDYMSEVYYDEEYSATEERLDKYKKKISSNQEHNAQGEQTNGGRDPSCSHNRSDAVR